METINSNPVFAAFVSIGVEVIGEPIFTDVRIRELVASTPNFWQEDGEDADLKGKIVTPEGSPDRSERGTTWYGYRLAGCTLLRASQFNAFGAFLERMAEHIAQANLENVISVTTDVDLNAHLMAGTAKAPGAEQILECRLTGPLVWEE